VDLHIDIPEDFTLKIEPGDLMELLGNLMENAFRHARSEVRITGDTHPPYTLVIDDDGQGIPAEMSEHLLHRGIRADQRHPGEGIGLAVVSEILSQYGATLDIQDSPLGGARFSMHFDPGHAAAGT